MMIKCCEMFFLLAHAIENAIFVSKLFEDREIRRGKRENFFLQVNPEKEINNVCRVRVPLTKLVNFRDKILQYFNRNLLHIVFNRNIS